MQGLLGIPLDVLVAIGVLAAFLVWNYTLGKNRSTVTLVALYVAGALMALVPLMDELAAALPIDATLEPIAMFVVLAAMVYVILIRCRFFDPYIVPNGWELGVFAFLQAVVAVAMVVSLEPSAVLETFSPNFSRVFLDPSVRSALLAGPVALFVLFRGSE